MKKAYLVIIVIFLISCNDKIRVNSDLADNITKLSIDKEKADKENAELEMEIFKLDSELLPIVLKDNYERFKYEDAFNHVMKNYKKSKLENYFNIYPELNLSNVLPPEELYGICEDKYYSKIEFPFSSEAGEDNFYLIYASVLEKRNGVENYARERENIIRIYQDLNDIDVLLAGGGSYYGHMESRIYGIAEYDLYKVINNIDLIDSSFDFSQAKVNYLKKIKKEVMKYLKSETEGYIFVYGDKKSFYKACLKILTRLDNNIKSYKSLHYAISFSSD
jgi:hypothetical protein